MAITARIVGGPIGQSDNTTHPVTLSDQIVAGEIAVVINGASTFNSGCPNQFTSIDSVGGGTFARDALNSPTSTGFVVEAWSAFMASTVPAGTVLTCRATTCPGNGAISPTFVVIAVNGLGALAASAAARFAGSAGNTVGFTSTPAAPSFTATQPNNIVFGVAKGNHNTSPFWTPGSGWTEIVDFGGAAITESGSSLAIQYRLQPGAATPVTSQGTSAGAETWSNLVVAYAAPSSAGLAYDQDRERLVTKQAMFSTRFH